MNAIEILKTQHRELEELFDRMDGVKGQSREERRIFRQLAKAVEEHAHLEERYLYSEGQEVDCAATLEGYEEHELVRIMIRKIKKTSTKDGAFGAKVKVMREILQHHISEEEDEYFPLVENSLGEDRMEQIGLELEGHLNRRQKREHKQELVSEQTWAA
ncbi:MAG: hemerythrin domain-containing protein [Deltaproteobacteria bacterium]|nr:hemerythrin domain-containing protein [Deltaproteobacteria bacterium]MBI3293266.1 hemerythrin domain-containing protein [Deltaproteobacteria bacterium]